ncbi:hypothetical protein ACWIGW_13025 [Nocardia brasiliensis]
MGHGTQTAFVEVHGDDAIDAEDATRAFGKSLSEIEDLTVDFSYFAPEQASGAKGVLDEVLRITLEYPWPLAAPLVAEKIKSLCLKERQGRVRVTVGDDVVEISGEPTDAQLTLLLELLRRPRG